MFEKKLLNTAIELVKLLDKTANAALPQELADVVKLHSKLAVGSAWIPIPGVDVAAGATNIWSMYVRINNKLGISVKENVLKTIASGVAPNLASYATMSGVASALKFIPGIGTLGGAAILSASLYAITIASGFVYLKALCTLAKRNDGNIDISQIGEAVKDALKDSSIASLIEDAKKEYKNQ